MGERTEQEKRNDRNLDCVWPLSFYTSFMATPCSLLTPFQSDDLRTSHSHSLPHRGRWGPGMGGEAAPLHAVADPQPRPREQGVLECSSRSAKEGTSSNPLTVTRKKLNFRKRKLFVQDPWWRGSGGQQSWAQSLGWLMTPPWNIS